MIADRDWYAVQTGAGAYRLHKCDDDEICLTNIEIALGRSGFEFYLPIERRIIFHHRTKKLIRKRFPLLPGYVFVANVSNWPALCDVDGVVSVLGTCGAPLKIPMTDMARLDHAEATINEEIEQAQARLEMSHRRMTSRRLARMFPPGSSVCVKTGHIIAGLVGKVTATTGRKTVRATFDILGDMVPVEIAFDELDLVA
ncbi:MAG: hypothetical protein OEQ29_01720 [Alphaproteobacteria bacterium]|nr:hypothetical protein [Alphaproteobacteria bacterium]